MAVPDGAGSCNTARVGGALWVGPNLMGSAYILPNRRGFTKSHIDQEL